MVAGERANRKDGMILRKIPSKIANYIIRNAAGVRLKDYGCALKVFPVRNCQGSGFIWGTASFHSRCWPISKAHVLLRYRCRHHARAFGTSKYGLGRTFKVISDLMLMLFFKRYMQKPMHLFGNLGVILFVIGDGN